MYEFILRSVKMNELRSEGKVVLYVLSLIRRATTCGAGS